MPTTGPQTVTDFDLMVERLTPEAQRGFTSFALKDSPIGQELLAFDAEGQRLFVLAALKWLRVSGPRNLASWYVRLAMIELLKRKLPLNEADIVSLMESALGPVNYAPDVPQIIKAIEYYLQQQELTTSLADSIKKLIASLEAGYSNSEVRRWVVRLKGLCGVTQQEFPLVPGEAWSDIAIADIRSFDEKQQSAWISLIQTCATVNGARPGSKWLKVAEPQVEAIGFSSFKTALVKWFPLVDKPRTQRVESWPPYQHDPNNLIVSFNADILKGLAWLCIRQEDKELARALGALAMSAYRKVPGIGPRCVSLGNACVWALGNMPGMEGVGQLALLKIKVKFGTAQKGIEAALTVAAQRSGLPREEIEEMSVPAYGMQEVGRRRDELGEFAAEIVVTGTTSAELRWSRSGKKQSSVPAAVKQEFADDLKELTQAVKDIRKMLPAQRDRIDNLYLENKQWSLPIWRQRYLDHPLMGVLAQRLIWRFSDGGRTASAIWHEDRMKDSNGHILDWLTNSTIVEMWHPIQDTIEGTLAWRNWLEEHQVQQPFKQAHREIYLLTDAERHTGVYSNRFAAHIIRQHQFNALCGVRGWKNKLRLMVDDTYPPATRTMPPWGLRAEFWIEGVGEDYGSATNESGAYLYLATDQVRFYRIDAGQNYAHAGGGGYDSEAPGRGNLHEPLSLEQIPPLVFSEIMRDVDLFVGVASIGNDPTWSDGGRQALHREYWTSYSFGDLSETAKTRKQVLERLLPRLKIAERCHIEDRFLKVRGDIRTYKIHLGSGNILMEPNDQYLCIVAARGAAAEGLTGKVFLPFEGDNVLPIILSKAFMLAADSTITDSTIVSQIGRDSKRDMETGFTGQ